MIVFGVVTNDVDVMLLFFFSHGLRLNTEAYIKCPKEVLQTRIKRVTSRRLYIRQLDCAPWHTCWRTQSWLSKHFWDHITPNIGPPNSPDCNLLGYYVWGTVECEANGIPCYIKDELKAKITAAFTHLNWKPPKRLTRDSKVIRWPWLKLIVISLNKSNL